MWTPPCFTPNSGLSGSVVLHKQIIALKDQRAKIHLYARVVFVVEVFPSQLVIENPALHRPLLFFLKSREYLSQEFDQNSSPSDVSAGAQVRVKLVGVIPERLELSVFLVKGPI